VRFAGGTHQPVRLHQYPIVTRLHRSEKLIATNATQSTKPTTITRR
jgi:hypothetical protein